MTISIRERGGCVRDARGHRQPTTQTEGRPLLPSCEAQASELSTGNGMEKQADIGKTAKWTRKMGAEHKRKQQEILRFPALVYGSYKGKN